METAAKNAGAVAGVFANKFVKAMGKQLPSAQEEQGDDLLNQARELVTDKVQSIVCGDDLKVIEEKITYVREMKVGLNTKSGFRKYRYAREYHKLAKGVYRHVKLITERTYDQYQFHFQPDTSSETENICRTARSLYRCWLGCKDAFPSSFMQDKWVEDAWHEACLRTGANPNSIIRQDEEIKCGSMKFLTDVKTKTKIIVESSYGFDTSLAPQCIARNASRAQALLDKTTFIHQEINFGGRSSRPYQHPIIQKIVNTTWFQSKDDIGIVFHDHFNPIPFEAIALVLTVIECCIDEWSTGTFNESSRKEVRYKTKYFSHLNSLRDLDARSPHQNGKDLLRQIQDDLLRDARIHAGATPNLDRPAGPKRLSINVLDAAIQYDSLDVAVQAD